MIGSPGKFALKTEDGVAAFKLVASWLPPHFVQGAFCRTWLASMQAGQVHHREARALLPEPDQWPVLVPVCSDVSGGDPRDIFLQTLNAKALRFRHLELATAAFAQSHYFRMTGVADSRATPLHQDRHNLMMPVHGPWLALLWREKVWACRCSPTMISPSLAKLRGIEVRDDSDLLGLIDQ